MQDGIFIRFGKCNMQVHARWDQRCIIVVKKPRLRLRLRLPNRLPNRNIIDYVIDYFSPKSALYTKIFAL